MSVRKQEAAAAVFRQNKPRDVPPYYTRFYALHMGNCPYLSAYQLSGKRYAPSFLQGHPPSLRFGHPDVTTGDTAFLTVRRAMPFLRSCRGTRPRFASGTLMSLPEGIATPRTRLDSREAHPVLARQLRIRLHKALRSRTRGTENAHTLITHRLKQAQQLRGHVGCRQ